MNEWELQEALRLIINRQDAAWWFEFRTNFQGQKGGFSRPIPVNLANSIVARNSLIALPFGRRTLFLDKKLIRDKNIILQK